MRGIRQKIEVGTVLAMAMVQGTIAETAFIGARAMGMGGANAVSTRDASAQWYNPAAFGFMHSESNSLDRSNLGKQDWGWSIVDIGAGYTLTGEMGKYLDLFTDIDFDAFTTDGLKNTPDSISSLLEIGSIIDGIDASDAAYVDANIGTGVRIGHWGIGLRLFSEATAFIEPDTTQLGIDQSASDFVNAINQAAASDGFNATGYNFQTLTASEQSSLKTKLEGNTDAVKYLDKKLTEIKESSDLTKADVSNAIALINEIDFNAGGGASSFSNNLSYALGRAFGVVEIPVSYGHSFFDNSLSVGITAKGMYGSVTGTKIWFFDEDAIDDAISVTSDNTEASLNFGIDLGLLYRLPFVQLAVVGHNLNSPTFKGFTDTVDVNGTSQQVVIDDVTLDPQVTLGAAFIPSRRFMVELDYDVLKVGTLLDGYDIQRLSVGGELDVWLLALRLGAYNNMALDDSNWVATAGLGLNIFGVRLDVGGAYSLDNSVTYDGTDIPTEARLFASLSLDY